MSKTAHHELTRKEMKGPDKFQVAATEAAAWASTRRRQIVFAGVGAVVVLAAVLAFSAYLESQRASAGGLLYRAIDAASGEVSSIPLPGVDRIYKSSEEKQRAVLEAAGAVRERHGASRAAATAALLQGDAHLALGEWDKAIASYQTFLDKASSDDSLRFGGLDGLARAQEGKGDLAAAAATYERAAQIDFYRDRAALERARVLVKAGKKDEALKALEGVGKDSPLSVEAQERLARLGK
ncbi:MAG TPA: tetratricopeptide repeat protein [Anaeromyxobacteraceae bacterium]